jgi:hypothetical protein
MVLGDDRDRAGRCEELVSGDAGISGVVIPD